MKTKIAWTVNVLLIIAISALSYSYEKLMRLRDQNLMFVSKEQYIKGYKDGHAIGSMKGWKDGAVMCVLEKQEKDK